MNHFLLTGAGFTRNWGGILASEMFNQLLGSALLDEPLRRLLLRDRNFEACLGIPSASLGSRK